FLLRRERLRSAQDFRPSFLPVRAPSVGTTRRQPLSKVIRYPFFLTRLELKNRKCNRVRSRLDICARAVVKTDVINARSITERRVPQRAVRPDRVVSPAEP